LKNCYDVDSEQKSVKEQQDDDKDDNKKFSIAEPKVTFKPPLSDELYASLITQIIDQHIFSATIRLTFTYDDTTTQSDAVIK